MKAQISLTSKSVQKSSPSSLEVSRNSIVKDQEKRQNGSFSNGFIDAKTSAGSGETPTNNFGFSNFDTISILPPSSISLQPKLKINAPNDKYEQEADRVAEQVMRMPAQAVQRKCEKCGHEEEVGHAPKVEIQRKCSKCEKEEERIQTKSTGSSATLASPSLINQIQNTRGGGHKMDKNTRSFMEGRFGFDFAKVKIHSNSDSAQMCQDINARAFTVGNDIYFNQGTYRPGEAEGKKLLAHELTHTIQQSNNGTVPTTRIQKSEDETGSSSSSSSRSSSSTQAAQSGSGGPRVRIHVLGAERESGTTRQDTRLEEVVRQVATADSGSELIIVNSFSNMVEQLDSRVRGNQCLGEVTVWNHAKPIYGSQRIAQRREFNTETNRFETHTDSFSADALVGEDSSFEPTQINRLRRLFCCDGHMFWRGCGNMSFNAPEGRERSEVSTSSDSDSQETQQANNEHRYQRFGSVYHSREEAERNGANLLASRDNTVGAQLWSDALCIGITGTNDLLYPDPNSDPAFYIGHGGGEVTVHPQADVECDCDPSTNRITGDMPSQQSMRDRLEQTCPEEALNILHASIIEAQSRVDSALQALNSLSGISAGARLEAAGQRNANRALEQAFSFGVDYSLFPLMGASASQIANYHAESQGFLSQVINRIDAVRQHLSRYHDAPSCPTPSRQATAPCFSCKLDQFPTCDRDGGSNAAAFVREINSVFHPAISICPSFFLNSRGAGLQRVGRSSVLFHEFTHIAGTVDAIGEASYYGCPVHASNTLPVDPRWFENPFDQTRYEECLAQNGYGVDRTNLNTSELLTIADAYRCFLDMFDGSLPIVPNREGLLTECVEGRMESTNDDIK